MYKYNILCINIIFYTYIKFKISYSLKIYIYKLMKSNSKINIYKFL